MLVGWWVPSAGKQFPFGFRMNVEKPSICNVRWWSQLNVSFDDVMHEFQLTLCMCSFRIYKWLFDKSLESIAVEKFDESGGISTGVIFHQFVCEAQNQKQNIPEKESHEFSIIFKKHHQMSTLAIIIICSSPLAQLLMKWNFRSVYY